MTDVAAPGGAPSGQAASSQGTRILALDAARTAAIVGMIAVNVGPRNSGGFGGLLYELPLGRASLLFMILAGVGMSLLSRTARKPGAPLPWQTILWRSAVLLAGGLALQMLNHEVSVILPLYGLLFLLCLPLLKAPTRIVAAVTAAVFAVGPIVWIAVQMATGNTYQFTAPRMSDSPLAILEAITFSGPYPAVIWATPFLLGLLLGRTDLGNPRVQKRLVWWGTSAMVGGYAVSRSLIGAFGQPGDEMGMDRLVSAVDHSQMPLWLVSGTGSALLVLGVFLLAGDFFVRRMPVLVSAGRLSLTIYVAHLVLLAALVRPEPHTLLEGVLITAAFCLAAISLAHLWTRRFRAGPLEALLRWPRKSARSTIRASVSN